MAGRKDELFTMSEDAESMAIQMTYNGDRLTYAVVTISKLKEIGRQPGMFSWRAVGHSRFS